MVIIEGLLYDSGSFVAREIATFYQQVKRITLLSMGVWGAPGMMAGMVCSVNV